MKQKNSIKGNKNLVRILTGVIGLPIVIAILVLGNKYVIDVVFSIVAIISIHEYFKAIEKQGKPYKVIGYIMAIYIAFIHIIPKQCQLATFVIMIPTTLAILFIKVIISNMKTNFNDITMTFFGIIYIIGFISFIPLLYGSINGKILIWYLFISAWATDTFAYAVGMKFGKKKLSIISPKKSVEGSIGGVLGSVVVGITYTALINHYTLLNINYLLIIGILIVLSILSQLGDLAASTIKRYVDIKDFGNIIPGHGGMLDRIDSLIFIAPFAYFLLLMI